MVKKIALFIGILTSLWAYVLWGAQGENGVPHQYLQSCDQLPYPASTECVIVAAKGIEEVQNLFLFAVIISIISLTIAFWPKKHTPKVDHDGLI